MGEDGSENTYAIRITLVNETYFEEIWVTDNSADADLDEHEVMWREDNNFDAVNMPVMPDPDWYHDEPDYRSDWHMEYGYTPEIVNYVTTVDTLTQYLTLNAKAAPGSTILIKEMDATGPYPQYVETVAGADPTSSYEVYDPQVTVDDDENITLTATMLLDASKMDGSQKFLFVITDAEGKVGRYVLTVYRQPSDDPDDEMKFQTHILGEVHGIEKSYKENNNFATVTLYTPSWAKCWSTGSTPS